MRNYFKRVTIAFSIFLNVLFGGKSNQSFSAAQHQRRRDKKWNLCPIIDRIFFWELEHCLEAWVKWKLIHRSLNHYDNIGEDFFQANAKKFEDFV